ncbi:hypothetical protein E2C01_075867 [Portunus trituberculatus]|uniref:Uncharacterized protein n=1 Tax=Portunus trituberculatus TaxID=210409 RepID=A0A5B7I9U3_PORTR|nr:hypothetical protein [Portunus trituberculatus]
MAPRAPVNKWEPYLLSCYRALEVSAEPHVISGSGGRRSVAELPTAGACWPTCYFYLLGLIILARLAGSGAAHATSPGLCSRRCMHPEYNAAAPTPPPGTEWRVRACGRVHAGEPWCGLGTPVRKGRARPHPRPTD